MTTNTIPNSSNSDNYSNSTNSYSWNYGITTVPKRIDNGLLSTTVKSLSKGGFWNPTLFVDGTYLFSHKGLHTYENSKVVLREQTLGAMGNWYLALWHLFIETPKADIYAIFQDDIICGKNLKRYIEESIFKCPNYPSSLNYSTSFNPSTNFYLNLYTAPSNMEFLDKKYNTTPSTLEPGWYPSNQNGQGALALVFTNQCVQDILSNSTHFLKKFTHLTRAKKCIDGEVRNILYGDPRRPSKYPGKGYVEYVHYPSLVQHMGDISTVGNLKNRQNSPCFFGEDYDCMSLLHTLSSSTFPTSSPSSSS